ncbi:MAG: protein kinase [Fischerella sp.]|nr:protein kinase [Fischerella sp.]
MRDVLPHGTLLQNGNYRIDYALGRGGFGITYQAIHTALKKQIAIKEFYPQEQALRDGAIGNLIVPTAKQEIYQRGLKRFLREGQTLAKLNHPNVVRVENFFEERGTAYLVMELITGNTLREELDAQPNKNFSPARVEAIASALVGALEAVHQQGIYHLDLKPDNVLTTPEERIVLVDFGASRQDLSSGTTSQAFTFNYAPPEVIAGKSFGAASDLFELGMMLHEMLTGKLPPNSLDRFYKDNWSPVGLPEPWFTLLTSALRLPQEERPQNVSQWWQSRIFVSSISKNISQNKVCQNCGTINYKNNSFCQNCGQVLQSNLITNSATLSNSTEKTIEIHPDNWGKTEKRGLLGFIDKLLDDR